MLTLKSVSSLFVLLISLFFASLAFAQDASVSVDAQVSGSGSGGMVRPLDLIKTRAQQIKNSIPGAKVDANAEAHINAQTDSNFPQGNRGQGGGAGMQKERMASSTPGRGLKALLLMHGGEIKNRFRLAIAHFNNILGRIDTRLGKMHEAGIDTSSAAKVKVDADLAVDKAEADAKAVADFAATVDDSSDRAAVKAELQAKVKTATESLKAAHMAVLKAVRALVELAKQNKGSAGASVDTSTSVDTSVQ